MWDHPLTAGQTALLGRSKASGSARNGGSGNGTDPPWKAPPPLCPRRVLSDEEQRIETARRLAHEATVDRRHRMEGHALRWRRHGLAYQEIEEARNWHGHSEDCELANGVLNPRREQFVPLQPWPRTSPQDTRPRDDTMCTWDNAYGQFDGSIDDPMWSGIREYSWQRMLELSVLQFDMQSPESLRREIHRTQSCVEGKALVTQYLADCYDTLQRNQRAMDEIAARRHLIRVILDLSQAEHGKNRADRVSNGKVARDSFLACVRTTAMDANRESNLAQMVDWDHTWGTRQAVAYVQEYVREPTLEAVFLRHQAAYMASRTLALVARKEVDDTRRWLEYNAHMNDQFMDQRHAVYTSFCDACVTFTSVVWHVDEGSGLHRKLVPFVRCTCGHCMGVLLDPPTAVIDGVVDRQGFIDSVALVPSIYRSDWYPADDPDDVYMDWIRAPSPLHSDSTAIPGSASLSGSVSRESDFPMIPIRDPSL